MKLKRQLEIQLAVIKCAVGDCDLELARRMLDDLRLPVEKGRQLIDVHAKYTASVEHIFDTVARGLDETSTGLGELLDPSVFSLSFTPTSRTRRGHERCTSLTASLTARMQKLVILDELVVENNREACNSNFLFYEPTVETCASKHPKLYQSSLVVALKERLSYTLRTAKTRVDEVRAAFGLPFREDDVSPSTPGSSSPRSRSQNRGLEGGGGPQRATGVGLKAFESKAAYIWSALGALHDLVAAMTAAKAENIQARYNLEKWKEKWSQLEDVCSIALGSAAKATNQLMDDVRARCEDYLSQAVPFHQPLSAPSAHSLRPSNPLLLALEDLSKLKDFKEILQKGTTRQVNSMIQCYSFFLSLFCVSRYPTRIIARRCT